MSRRILALAASGALAATTAGCGATSSGSAGSGGAGRHTTTISVGRRGASVRAPARTIHLKVVKGPHNATIALLPVYIDNQGPFAFALDTGAAKSVIDQKIVKRLGLQEVGPAHQVTGVTGSEQVHGVRVDNWRVGGVKLQSRMVADINLPNPGGAGPGLQGLLGSDVLSSFGLVAVDYDRQVLLLRAHQR